MVISVTNAIILPKKTAVKKRGRGRKLKKQSMTPKFRLHSAYPWIRSIFRLFPLESGRHFSELHLIQPGIGSVSLHQLVMRTLLFDPALSQHDNPFRIPNGG